jgi:hypothetical protein
LLAVTAVLLLTAVVGAAWRWLTLQAAAGIDPETMLLVLRRLTVSALSLDAYSVHLACVQWFRNADSWLLGDSFVQVVTNPIPRALWEGKPESFGFTIAQLMGNYTTNFGPTAFGEGFANFGLLGSVMFGWLLGLVARVIERYQARGLPGAAMVLVAMVTFEMFAQVRGDLQGITTPMLERITFLIFAVLVADWLGKLRSGRLAKVDAREGQ